MALLTELAHWPETIYRMERNDPLMGGEYGVSNVQARQLAERTQWLRAMFAAGHRPDGGHLLDEGDVAPDAAIPESRLALDYATAALRAENASHAAAIDDLTRALYEAEGGQDTPLDTLRKGLELFWRYGDRRCACELFGGEHTFRDEAGAGVLRECIAGDDSIDVDDTSILTPGDAWVLLDPDGGRQEVITVKAVLTKHRFLSTESAVFTRRGGVISRTSWRVDAGRAKAPAGSVLFSRELRLLAGYDLGRLNLRYRPGTGDRSRFAVACRPDRLSVWAACEALDDQPTRDGARLARYRTPGGPLFLRVTARDAAVVEHMVLTVSPECLAAPLVRTPKGAGRFVLTRFGALYGAAHAATDILVSAPGRDAPDFSREALALRLPPLPATGTTMDAGPAVTEALGPLEGDRWWKARYQSAAGAWSLWSAAAALPASEPERQRHG